MSRATRPRQRVAMLLTTTVCGALLAACGSTSAPRSAGAPNTEMNDPALSAAADTVEPMLEKSFPRSFAGLVLDHPNHLMTIYRRPDPSLDAAVRRAAPDVRVAFRDARFTLVQLRELAGEIVADRSYWGGRGVEIQSAAPMVDGSGVRVGTTRGTAQEAVLLAQHYHVPGEITVERISAVPDAGGTGRFVPDVGTWPLPSTPAQTGPRPHG